MATPQPDSSFADAGAASGAGRTLPPDRANPTNPPQTLAGGKNDAPTLPPMSEVPRTAEATMVGTGGTLGPYRLLEKLGEGGMGAVYKARHEHLDKLVAVKILPQHVTERPDAVARFKREMKAVGKITHPNIVQAFDAGEIGGTHYLAMEYVEGSDLHKLVKDKGPLSPANACRALRQAAIALAAAHAVGLVHRDIKPSNLLVAKNGQIKVLDLGLARLAGEANKATDLTAAGQAFGTPDYMAPEQWEDAREADPRTDLYALGCTLFFLLTGRAPFDDDKHQSSVSKMTAHVMDVIPDLHAARADVPDGIAAIYQRLLAKQPADRFQNATELAESLHPFASGKVPANQETARAAHERLSAQPPDVTRRANEEARMTRGASAPEAALEREALLARCRGARELIDMHRYQEATNLLADIPGAENVPGVREVLFEAQQRQFEVDSLLATIQQTLHRTDGQGRRQLRAALERLRLLQPDHLDVDVQLTRLDRIERGRLRIPLPGRTDPLDIPWVAAIPAVIVGGMMAVLGVWVIVRDKSDKVIARVEVPQDGSVAVTPDLTTDKMIDTPRADQPASEDPEPSITEDSSWHGWPADAPQPAIAPFDTDEAKKHQEEWAAYLNIPVQFTNSIGMQFRLIPPGEFIMGSSPAEIKEGVEAAIAAKNRDDRISRVRSEGPQHRVVLTKPFYLGTHEVTQKQFAAVMEKNPSHFAPTGSGRNAVTGRKTDVLPAENLPFAGANRFCKKLNKQELVDPGDDSDVDDEATAMEGTGYRLPTEAEWEFACRGGTTTKYWTGDREEDLLRDAWLKQNAGERTHAVGERAPNPFGLFDMHGNVAEWNRDIWTEMFYLQFADRPAINPLDNRSKAKPFHSARGGHWEVEASAGRSSARHGLPVKFTSPHIGFRVAIAADAVRKATPAPADASDVAAFDEWLQGVAKMPGEQQLEAVAQKLQELNQGFDGKLGQHKVHEGKVVSLQLFVDEIQDLSPLRALTTLKALTCSARKSGAKLKDLSPLSDLSLTNFFCGGTQLSDLSPLSDMPLTFVDCSFCPVEDLTPLAKAPLDFLYLQGTPCRSLAPLQGKRLKVVLLNQSPVSDLSPLLGMPLTMMQIANCPSLSKLPSLNSQSWPELVEVNCGNTPLVDAELLKFAHCKKLQTLYITSTKASAAGVKRLQQALPKCKIVWKPPPGK